MFFLGTTIHSFIDHLMYFLILVEKLLKYFYLKMINLKDTSMLIL